VADVEVAVAANGNPAATGRHLNHRQQFAVRVELLHAIVVEVGDEDLVRGVNGNADREMELPGLRAFAAPFPEEARRGRFGSWLWPSKAPGASARGQTFPPSEASSNDRKRVDRWYMVVRGWLFYDPMHFGQHRPELTSWPIT